jgi:hypothetical protein
MAAPGADLPVGAGQDIDIVAPNRVVVAPEIDPAILESPRHDSNQLVDPRSWEHRGVEDAEL